MNNVISMYPKEPWLITIVVEKYASHLDASPSLSIVDNKIIFRNFFYLSLGDIFKTNLVHKNSIYTFIWSEINQMKNLILNHLYMKKIIIKLDINLTKLN
jgi:hypothetical protein